MHPRRELEMASVVLPMVFLTIACTVLAANNNGDQCYVYYGGMVFPEETRRTVEHGMHWSKTQSRNNCFSGVIQTYMYPDLFSVNEVSKPAPDWNGTAVVNGEFKELKLADFKGM